MDISSTGGASSVAARVANLGLYGDAPAVTPKSAAAPIVEATDIRQPSPAPAVMQVNNAVNSINKMLQSSLSQDLEFSFDADANRAIVKVIDQKTKEVIRQMPTAEALEIAKALDKLQGLLIKQEA